MKSEYISLSGVIVIVIIGLLIFSDARSNDKREPITEWGHWRLGHRSDFDFLEENKMTVTFGSGAPNFESVSRDEFDEALQQAIVSNRNYNDRGYIVLRYMTSSLHGRTPTRDAAPEKHQLDLVDFYNERWEDYEDYIGPKPPESENPQTWITIHHDGSFPHYRYAPYGRETTERFETWGCPNNPYFVRLMEGRIRSQAETGIDGVYIDWTHMAGGTCYCGYCVESFRDYLNERLPKDISTKKYGHSDYKNVSLPLGHTDPFWMEWVVFRGHTLAEFHKQLRSSARQYNPHFLISGNVYGGFGFGPIAYDAAGNMEMFGRDGYHDFIYSEIQEFLDTAPRKSDHGIKITNGPALKFLAAAAHGKPVIVYATEITPPIFPDPTPQVLGAMAQINIAESVANQAIFREKRETPQEATEIYNFLYQNEQSLVGAHKYSNIAILTSLNQFFAREQSYSFSLSRVLSEKGIAHVMCVEDDISNGYVNKFNLVILPYIPLLSAEKQNKLLQFVEDGGNLLILGRSGSKDEYNVSHETVVLESAFPENTYPRYPLDVTRGKGRISYIPLRIPESKFLISPKETDEVTTFGPAMEDVFADIPGGYTRGRIDPELQKILGNAANKSVSILNNSVTQLENNTPIVEISTMLNRTSNRLLLHLVNYDVTIDGVVTPARDTKIRLVLPEDSQPGRLIYSGVLGEMTPVDYSIVNDGSPTVIEFIVDGVHIYGLAVLELK
jgi:hypothetical protein